MAEGVVLLALGAGVVAAVNPCGFALLPAYLSMLLLEDQPSRTVAVARAVRSTAALTTGFAAVFAAFGLAIAPVAGSVQQYLPGFTVAMGLALIAAGGWMLSGRRLWSPRGSSRRTARPLTASTWSMAGFGASYAVASLGCTIAPFLAVVVTAFRSGTVAEGVVLFLAYAAGMGLVVGTAAVAVALGRQGLLRGLRRTGRFLPALSGGLLVVTGAYVAWYGAWELRVLHTGAGPDPVVTAAGDLQRWLAGQVASIGAVGFLVALAALLGFGLRPRRRPPDPPPPTVPPSRPRNTRATTEERA